MITVLMSVYNGQRWLEEAMISVLKQTEKDFEFIVINDGSVDNSLSVISRIAKTDERIVVVDKSNTGLADSLNCGISKARGEWIARIDADDVYHMDRLQKQYEMACMDSSLILIGSSFIMINRAGEKIKKYKYPQSDKALRSRLKKAKAFFPHSSAFYRADIARQIGGYREKIVRSQDYDMWLRMSSVGKIGCHQDPLVKIRKHEGQVSNIENGKRQKIDAYVSLISYWSRCYGYEDPVDMIYEDYELFFCWLEEELSQKQVFKYHYDIDNIKKAIWGNGIDRKPVCEILRDVVNNYDSIKYYLHRSLYGDRFAKKLAHGWANNSQIRLIG